MRLTDLSKFGEWQSDKDLDQEVFGLTSNSSEVIEGTVFVAIMGTQQHGIAYAKTAVAKGAIAIMTNRLPEEKVDVPILLCEDIRSSYALACADFYEHQPKHVVAVTGTNGKTSTTIFARQLWSLLGFRAANIGTIGTFTQLPLSPKIIQTMESGLTSLDPTVFFSTLRNLYDDNVTHVAFEASSHGLDQSRMSGVKIEAGAFTNITHDHLDYHGTMEDYFVAKAKIFGQYLSGGGVAVINHDIPEYAALATLAKSRNQTVIDYGNEAQAIKLLSRKPIPNGSEVSLQVMGKTYDLLFSLIGDFQVSNAMAALGLVMADPNIKPDDAVPLLRHLKSVEGRLEFVGENRSGGAVYVDYAHTPDALMTILGTVRPHAQNRLILVFGCGGNRDAAKRPIMGDIARKLADVTIVTDDNPRLEDPAAIRAQIRAAHPESLDIGDRRDAIRAAVKMLSHGDILLIAGKGHERTQIIGTQEHRFHDVTVAQQCMQEI